MFLGFEHTHECAFKLGQCIIMCKLPSLELLPQLSRVSAVKFPASQNGFQQSNGTRTSSSKHAWHPTEQRFMHGV